MKARYRAYSFAYLLMAVHKARGRVRREKRYHPFSDCLAMLTFSAMAIEAFVNHLGPHVLLNWAPLKRKLSPLEKLQIIADARNVKIDWGSRPYQSVAAVVKFRNAVAHAETVDVSPDVVFRKSAPNQTYWQSYCEREVAERLSEDVEVVIKAFPREIGVEMPKEFLLSEHVEED